MKINVKGDTPMERLTNLTRGLLAVPKVDIDRQVEQKKRTKRRAKRPQQPRRSA